MNIDWAMGLLVLAPLFAAALAFVLPQRGRALVLAVAGVVGLAVYRLATEVMENGPRTHRAGGWGAPLGIDLRVDGLAVVMLGVTAVIAAVISGYARGYFAAGHGPRDTHRVRYFWSLLLFLWTALNALFLSADLFNLYVTLELLGFAAVVLVALDGGREALSAAWRYLTVGLSASLFYLLGVGLVYGQCGTVDLALVASRADPGPTLGVALALMTGGLVAKAALFPLHFWLPPAHANAPAPVSALLSALVVKGPFYILLRLWSESFSGFMTEGVAQGFGALGAVAILWGSWVALRQPRLKLLIAYSTVAQLGYLFLVFPLGLVSGAPAAAWSGTMMLLAAHACAKTAMFLVAGSVLHAVGHDRLEHLRGFSRTLPVPAFAFGLAGLSIVGLPPSGGFAGKWLKLQSALEQGQWWWVAVLLIGGLLAAAYVLRVLMIAFLSPDAGAPRERVPRVMQWTALGLSLAAALLGFGTQALDGLLGPGGTVAVDGLAGGALP